MKKLKNILVAIIMTALLALSLSACGGFDPAAYVKGSLDGLYHGEITEEYVNTLDDGSTVESLEKDYNDTIDEETEMIVSNLGVESASKESIAKLREAVINVNKATRYEIGEVTENGDNYDVTITVYPLDIYNQTINSDDYLTRISEECSTPGISDPDFFTAAVERIAADITAAALDPQYEEPEEITVSIILDTNGYYSISKDSAGKIYNKLMNLFSL